jgi:transposase
MIQKVQVSNTDRERIVDAYLSGRVASSIAEILGINRSTVYGIIKAYKDDGRIQAKMRGGVQAKKLSPLHREQVKSWVDENCSLTLKSLATKCCETFNISVSQKTIDRCLADFHYTVKRTSSQPELRNSQDVLVKRADYSRHFMQILVSMDDTKLIFFDEAGFAVSMRARRKRSLQGHRAVHVVPNLRTRNISMFAAMSKTGLIYYSTQTRPFNTDTFVSVLQLVCIRLEELGLENCVFIGDNVPFHRSRVAQEALASRGHTLMYLPPYSPFLNPVESLFGKWKGGVRQGRPINEEELLGLIDDGRYTINVTDCAAWYRHMFGFLLRCTNMEEIVDE